MITRQLFKSFKPTKFSKVYILLFAWLSGLVWGYCDGLHSDRLVVDYFFAAAQVRPSVFVLILSGFFWLLISALAAFFIPFALFPVAFSKAFLYGSTLACIRLAFVSADWLMLLLLTFSATVSVPIYLFFWSSRLQQGSADILRNILISASALVLLYFADCCLISPFLYRVACYI